MTASSPDFTANWTCRWAWLGVLWVLLSTLAVADTPRFPERKDRIKVLIVDGYSNHDWERSTFLLRALLGPTDLFEVDVSTAPPTATSPGWETWRPAFVRYDVVIQTCNDIRGGPAWPKEVQVALEQFVHDGGGLYVFHGANNAFLDWPEYDRMIGLGWRPKERGWALAVNPDGTLRRFPPGEGRRTSHAPRQAQTVVRLGRHPIVSVAPGATLTR